MMKNLIHPGNNYAIKQLCIISIYVPWLNEQIKNKIFQVQNGDFYYEINQHIEAEVW